MDDHVFLPTNANFTLFLNADYTNYTIFFEHGFR